MAQAVGGEPCLATTADGVQCRNPAVKGECFCASHHQSGYPTRAEISSFQASGEAELLGDMIDIKRSKKRKK